MLAVHVRKTTEEREEEENEESEEKATKYERFVAFAGRESTAGEERANCVWIMKKRMNVAHRHTADEENDDRVEVDDTTPTSSTKKRARVDGGVAEESQDEGVWSICCVPMPPLYSVVSLDFYDGGVDGEWLVLLLSTGTGDTEIVLLDDCHVDVPYEQIQISLSARLPPTTTLVQLAEEAGVLRDPTLYEKMKQSSERINNACPTSMDVCAGRGKITICTDKRTLSLFTPEEDEDEDDDL